MRYMELIEQIFELDTITEEQVEDISGAWDMDWETYMTQLESRLTKTLKGAQYYAVEQALVGRNNGS